MRLSFRLFSDAILDGAGEIDAYDLKRTITCLVPRGFGLFTSLSARGTAREGEKRKIRREAPGRIRIQNGGSVFCKCSVLFILLLKWHIVYSKIRVRTLPLLFRVQYLIQLIVCLVHTLFIISTMQSLQCHDFTVFVQYHALYLSYSPQNLWLRYKFWFICHDLSSII
jgi:hypothetical protein